MDKYLRVIPTDARHFVDKFVYKMLLYDNIWPRILITQEHLYTIRASLVSLIEYVFAPVDTEIPSYKYGRIFHVIAFSGVKLNTLFRCIITHYRCN